MRRTEIILQGDRDRSEEARPLYARWPNDDLIGGDEVTALKPSLNDRGNYRPCGGNTTADDNSFRIDAVNKIADAFAEIFPRYSYRFECHLVILIRKSYQIGQSDDR